MAGEKTVDSRQYSVDRESQNPLSPEAARFLHIFQVETGLTPDIFSDVEQIKAALRGELGRTLKTITAEALDRLEGERVALYLEDKKAQLLFQITKTEARGAQINFYKTTDFSEAPFYDIHFAKTEFKGYKRPEFAAQLAVPTQKISSVGKAAGLEALRHARFIDQRMGDFLKAFAGVVRTNADEIQLIDIDDRLRGVQDPALRQELIDFLATSYQMLIDVRGRPDTGPAFLKRTYFAFISEDPEIMKSFSSDALEGIIQNPETIYTYHGNADTLNREKINKALSRAGVPDAKIDSIRVGVAPYNIGADESKVDVYSVPAATSFFGLVARLDLGEGGLDEAALKKMNTLIQFAKMLIDPLYGGDLVSDINNLKALQEFKPGFNYLKLAIHAIERLDIDGFIQYAKLAIRHVLSAA